jgi:phosphatidate cytidylyltransferase
MVAEREFLWLAGGIVAFLACFSVVGFVLDRRVTGPAARDAVRNLNARLRSWWVMVAFFTAAITAGEVVTLVLFALLSFLALREFVTLIQTRRGDHRSLFVAFFVVIPAQYYLIGIDWYGLFSELWPKVDDGVMG